MSTGRPSLPEIVRHRQASEELRLRFNALSDEERESGPAAHGDSLSLRNMRALTKRFKSGPITFSLIASWANGVPRQYSRAKLEVAAIAWAGADYPEEQLRDDMLNAAQLQAGRPRAVIDIPEVAELDALEFALVVDMVRKLVRARRLGAASSSAEGGDGSTNGSARSAPEDADDTPVT